ncbi:MAG TPA: VWA domain-containing protein [Thermoanaerobaculia bacterium]|nr:VWA domain-containing protein [Thermoanaerobaculia bacterium]
MKFVMPVLLTLLAVAPARAQSAWTQQVAWTQRDEPRVVDIEAVVTDSEGNRVSGLAAGDFRLLVDGTEVPVGRFTEVAEGTMGRSYLLFIDDSLSLAVQRDLVLWEIERDLDRLGPGDRMAIVAFDGSRLHPLADWTGDRAVLAAAFAEARRRPGNGIPALAEGRSARFAIVAGDAAAKALRGFSLPPGRKAMLVLSGGWPAGPSLELIRDANRLGYTLYPVDVPGLDLARAFTTSDGEQASHDTLLALAQATGGQPAINSARLAALEQAEEDTRSYYWLGFSPSWKADDRNHRIELEVRRPGLAVRARHSFSDLSPETLAGMETEDLLLFGLEAGDQETGD